MTIREEASQRLAQNLQKVVQVARMTYNRQSPFYRQCNSISQHVDRMVNHFFQGFYQEIKVERSQAFKWVRGQQNVLFGTPLKGKAIFQQA